MTGFPVLEPFGGGSDPEEPGPGSELGYPPPIVWPAFGVSHYLALTDPQCDPVEYAAALASVGASMTRVWLCDPWACGTGETGCYDGFVPVRQLPDGRWDLFAWDPAYFDRLRVFTAALWGEGIWPVYTLLNLYQFARRKEGQLWVPDMSRLPWRANINGVHWGDPDDPTFFSLPDEWLREFSGRVVATLGQSGYCLEIGNEMPEKPLHERMADHLRAVGYRGEITVNRNEDAPGQFGNMRIGPDGRYQRIAFHGQDTLAYLDKPFPHEPRYQSFRELYDSGIEMARVVWSGDGVGNNNLADTYDEDAIAAVVEDMGQRGGSVEWQARELKLGRFLLGRFHLGDLYVDFARRLAAAFEAGQSAGKRGD